MRERRKYPRIPLTADAANGEFVVEIYVAGKARGPAQVTDISEEGICLKTREQLARFRPVYLYLVVESYHVCEARGTVAWVGEGNVGISLPRASQGFRHLVRELAELDPPARGEILRAMETREVHFE